MIIIWKIVYWKTHLILKAWKIWIFQYLRCDFFQRCRGTKSLADDSLAFAQSLPRGRPQWWSSECAKTTNWRWLNSTNEMFHTLREMRESLKNKALSPLYIHIIKVYNYLYTYTYVYVIYVYHIPFQTCIEICRFFAGVKSGVTSFLTQVPRTICHRQGMKSNTEPHIFGPNQCDLGDVIHHILSAF